MYKLAYYEYKYFIDHEIIFQNHKEEYCIATDENIKAGNLYLWLELSRSRRRIQDHHHDLLAPLWPASSSSQPFHMVICY